jgi:hypothetical protein
MRILSTHLRAHPITGCRPFVELYIQAYTWCVRFSWEARKSNRNLRERGFDFEFATQISKDRRWSA